MIISQIGFGLGNQLFQYATGLSLARHIKVPFFLDIINYETDLTREFCLNYFEINDIKTELDEEFEGIAFDYYEEPHFHFDNNFFNLSRFTYLAGFWQTEKYFTGIKDEILQRFQLRKKYTDHLGVFESDFHNFISISLHIRRGDYAYYTFLGIQPMDYYYRAINYFLERFDNVRFYIFSDDIDWVTKNLDIKAEHIFVSGNYTCNHIEDFYLMQQCKHHIIANSTFSWWAAWLSRHQEKRVIAPSKWFLAKDVDTVDLLPADWIAL